jgi:hypothetical protein
MGTSPFSMANIFDHLHQVLGLSGPLPGVIFNLSLWILEIEIEAARSIQRPGKPKIFPAGASLVQNH